MCQHAFAARHHMLSAGTAGQCLVRIAYIHDAVPAPFANQMLGEGCLRKHSMEARVSAETAMWTGLILTD